MKVVCIVSHELPHPTEPGKFKRYDAGAEYEMEYLDSTYFHAVHSSGDACLRAYTHRQGGHGTRAEERKDEKPAVGKTAKKNTMAEVEK